MNDMIIVSPGPLPLLGGLTAQAMSVAIIRDVLCCFLCVSRVLAVSSRNSPWPAVGGRNGLPRLMATITDKASLTALAQLAKHQPLACIEYWLLIGFSTLIRCILFCLTVWLREDLGLQQRIPVGRVAPVGANEYWLVSHHGCASIVIV